ncbi:hypothetical protein [Chroococcus sp. FPU101]|uniref:hypothetical protein n=1 Tax=Chroococcus sp. FPU101 TaxID=1974212 RepID=UPI001A8C2997|nr:hypothetical protein [Chroococcus sp. FPU101]
MAKIQYSKIAKSETAIATLVRDNNIKPVPPDGWVYLQHLIGVAIKLLQGLMSIGVGLGMLRIYKKL